MAKKTYETLTEAEALSRARARLRALHAPFDVQALPSEEIDSLCADVRRVLIDRTERNGGHLASNLGVVELTVAVHRVFDSPHDHIIFDVGHQSYVHKLLTGRAEAFDTLRQPGGLSGFPRRDESEHDAFGTGHASTSLSAAIGFAQADHLRGSDAYSVVVLGDGALTGGMIHEALNNCAKYLKLIIILNENEMSISKNVGHFARLLTRLRTSPGYYRTKTLLERLLDWLPLVGKPMLRGLRCFKTAVKRIAYRSNYFETLGLNYFGPADGHDEQGIEQLLRTAKAKGGCSLVHLRTVKGKGYERAEHDPGSYHGLSPTTQSAAPSPDALTFSEAFGQTLTALAAERPDVCAITAAMRQGTGLSTFFTAHPARFFDVGIAEEHAVTFAAGLAANGMLPVVALYSTFLQRAYDQVLHDAALQGLPMLIAVDRAGLNTADGATHHGIYDVAFLSHIPGVDIYEPPTTAALTARLTHLVEQGITHPVAVRYPSGHDRAAILDYMSTASEPCDGVYVDFDVSAPPKTVIVTYGRLTENVLAAQKLCEHVGVMVLERLRPWSETVRLLTALCERGVTQLLVCEEGIRAGGLGMNLVTELHEQLSPDVRVDMRIMAIDERTGDIPAPIKGQTSQEAVGLGVSDIVKAIKQKSV